MLGLDKIKPKKKQGEEGEEPDFIMTKVPEPKHGDIRVINGRTWMYDMNSDAVPMWRLKEDQKSTSKL